MSFGVAKEKRHFQRIFYKAEAMLVSDTCTLPCRVIDISLKGCLLGFDMPWSGSVEALYTLMLNLSDEVQISMKLSFSHGVGTQIGFRCDHIDIDSMTNLRRLVELNLGDSNLLTRDLNALTSG